MTPPRVFRSLEEATGVFGPCVLSIGVFDGVHAGHREILRRVVELSREKGWKPSAMTFDPHPLRVVAPERAKPLLSTPAERALLMAEEGIEQVLVLPFTRQVARMTPGEFARQILEARLGVRAVMVGSNFRFGHNHAGDTRRLTELGRTCGYSTVVIPAVKMRGRVISSSAVRRLIEAGEVSQAARLLVRPYALEGEVVSGRGIGSTLAAPTLNLETHAEVLPAKGVYVTRTTSLDTGRDWPSVTNVGVRPTFAGSGLTVESFLLDGFSGAAPGRIRVEFFLRLRDERKFPSAEALKAQIQRDVERARRYLRRARRLGCYTRKEPILSV
ncbi:MAG: bifunctional riboflavin kinase/FAD synthetase [Bryobacterales bacterium]|nr:bifunctional riboflavin kinase/FAD synthetase [Bryobacterales bacterium]